MISQNYSIPHAMLIIIQQVDVAQMHSLELKVVPIAKADEMSSPANYRLISILPIVSKVLECHISNIIMTTWRKWPPSQQTCGFHARILYLSSAFNYQ